MQETQVQSLGLEDPLEKEMYLNLGQPTIQIMALVQTLESPLDSKEIKPMNPKANQPWLFIGRTDTEALILWPPDIKSQLIGKGTDAGKDWRQKETGVTKDDIVGKPHWLSGHEFEQTPGDSEGQESLVCCRSEGHKESDTTEWLNNNKGLKEKLYFK